MKSTTDTFPHAVQVYDAELRTVLVWVLQCLHVRLANKPDNDGSSKEWKHAVIIGCFLTGTVSRSHYHCALQDNTTQVWNSNTYEYMTSNFNPIQNIMPSIHLI